MSIDKSDKKFAKLNTSLSLINQENRVQIQNSNYFNEIFHKVCVDEYF